MRVTTVELRPAPPCEGNLAPTPVLSVTPRRDRDRDGDARALAGRDGDPGGDPGRRAAL
jgi:hypothetical protein